MHRFWNIFHNWTNNFAAGRCWLEQLCSRVLSFESGKSDFSSFFVTFFTPQMRGKGWSWGAYFGIFGKCVKFELMTVTHPQFLFGLFIVYIFINWLLRVDNQKFLSYCWSFSRCFLSIFLQCHYANVIKLCSTNSNVCQAASGKVLGETQLQCCWEICKWSCKQSEIRINKAS